MRRTEIFPSQAKIQGEITSGLPVILKVCGPFVCTITAIVLRQSTGLRIYRCLGEGEATQNGFAKGDQVRFVPEETISQELFNTVRKEQPIFNRLKCRTIPNSTVFHTASEAVGTANEGKV